MKLHSTQSGRAAIDIAATMQSLTNIIHELLPAHAVSGCDTVAMFRRFGKAMLKTVQANKCSVSLLGDVNASVEDITKQTIAFVCRCYNSPNAATMTEARIKACVTNIVENPH